MDTVSLASLVLVLVLAFALGVITGGLLEGRRRAEERQQLLSLGGLSIDRAFAMGFWYHLALRDPEKWRYYQADIAFIAPEQHSGRVHIAAQDLFSARDNDHSILYTVARSVRGPYTHAGLEGPPED